MEIMCDYQALNAKTVHDMFLFSVIDELLDKLCGANFFTKLDRHSDYHQVCMEEARHQEDDVLHSSRPL
jgi:hypothetical protein